MDKKESREDYLERILMLQEKNGFVRAIDISTDMGYSKPSISIALKKLKSEGFILIDEKTNYISLTQAGLDIANNVYERHKVISSMLISLGVPEDIAFQDACKLEHDLSEVTFEIIKEHYLKMAK